MAAIPGEIPSVAANHDIREPVAVTSQASRRSTRKRRSGFGWTSILSTLFRWSLVAGIWAGVVVAGIVAYYALTLPDISSLEESGRKPSIWLALADGTVFASSGEVHGRPVKLGEMPKSLTHAVLATEDRRFFGHLGLDPIGLARAMVVNIREGAIRQGGSTLTQQLAKNLFLTNERSFGRKVQELILAVWLEWRFTKEEILTIYFNRVYLGAGTFGVAAASERYFAKDPRELNLYESALIAGLLKAPARYSPAASPERARVRTEQVLANMVDAGYLSQADADAAKRLPVGRGRYPTGGLGARYFADWVLDRVGSTIGYVDRDLVVTTTLDVRLQRLAEAEVEASLARNGDRRDVAQAALIALGADGRVVAMVGGRDYRDSQFNRATQALRQPGSAFKPFVYLAALEAGYGPDTIVEDAPIAIRNWSPVNFDRRFRGPMRISDAVTQSVNTVAVRVSETVGRSRVIDAAHRLGIPQALDDTPSLALGASEVTLLDLTQAYGAFATGGEAMRAWGILEIKDTDGRILYRRRPAPERVMSPGIAGTMTEMLANVVQAGTGRAARLDRPAAGKTGTTSNAKDALFVGFTADMVAGVWFGNDDGRPMKDVTGGGLPAELWGSFMRKASEGLPPRPLRAAPPEYAPVAQIPWYAPWRAFTAPQPGSPSVLRSSGGRD
ncbi:MAG: PBP1A family penicillin-binding protein [Alphaproteobacteria bacterium]|nr:PBP1A family penicillin-binding protein [Alphaproteobacteria bacterium]